MISRAPAALINKDMFRFAEHVLQLVEKASQSSRPQARNKSNPFFPATCAS
jgi:hypothetical protein